MDRLNAFVKQSFCSLRWSQDYSQVDHPCKANSLQAGKQNRRVHAAATLRLSFTYGYGESAGERFGRKKLWPETWTIFGEIMVKKWAHSPNIKTMPPRNDMKMKPSFWDTSRINNPNKIKRWFLWLNWCSSFIVVVKLLGRHSQLVFQHSFTEPWWSRVVIPNEFFLCLPFALTSPG